MAEKRIHEEHDELDLLLPWYVNGSLGPDEHERVRGHLDFCAPCRSNVRLLQQMRNATRRDPVAPMAPQPRFDELLDAIEADSAPEAARRRGTPLAIAASVVALIGAALFVLLDRLPPPSAPQIFETATTPAAAAAIDYIFEVEFAVDAQSGLRAQFVESLGATNLGPGDRPGSFRIAAAAPVTTAADLSEFIDSMSQYEGVRSVRFVAVQLPAQ